MTTYASMRRIRLLRLCRCNGWALSCNCDIVELVELVNSNYKLAMNLVEQYSSDIAKEI